MLDRNSQKNRLHVRDRLNSGQATAGFAPGDGAALYPTYPFAKPDHEGSAWRSTVGSLVSHRLLRPSVAVLGAGHGGLALAAFLAKNGRRVTLWNRSAARIAAVSKAGGVHLHLPGDVRSFAPIASATCDMQRALADCAIVLVAVPASAHADIARACAPYLRDGQTVLLLPGRTGGALEFRRTLRAAGCCADILLGEANTFPLAARCVGPAEATVFGTKDQIEAAALPAFRTEELVRKCRALLPMLTAARSVLHTGLGNVGAILHPTILLGNAKRIVRGEVFDFYNEGVTPHVAAVLTAADAERLSVARAYGVSVPSIPRWIAAAYAHESRSMLDAVGGNPAYVGIKAPATLNHRYLWEDVPTGLCPMLSLGQAAGLILPTLAGLVKLARQALGGAAWQRPRTVDALGLGGLSPVGIREYVGNSGPIVNIFIKRNAKVFVG